jgi:hypothetical protein
MAGFIWAYNESGGAPLIQTFVVKDTVVFSEFQLANFESGELDAAATSDSALVGAVVEAVDNTSDGLSIKCIVNRDAVYRVKDANIRVVGAALDIGSGGLTVASDSNSDLIVVESSTASEDTLVRFNDNYAWKV